MNIIDQINEATELLQNRRKLAAKGYKGSEYQYGRSTAFRESIAVLQDIKNAIEGAEKQQIIKKDVKKGIQELKKEEETGIQIV